jgi:hypothetical protein
MEWNSYQAWLILRSEAKWAGVGNAVQQFVAIGGISDQVDDGSSIEGVQDGSIENMAKDIVGTPVKKLTSKRKAAEAKIDIRPMRRKAGKITQTERRGFAAVESLVKSISRRNEVKQARVDLRYFDDSALDEDDKK